MQIQRNGINSNKPSDLILASMLHHFLVHNFVHHLKPFDSLLLCDADVLLLQRNRSERVVKEEQTTVKVHAEKPRNITVVWKSCRQRHQSHVFLCRLNVTNCPIKQRVTQFKKSI